MVFVSAKTGPANFGDSEARFTVQYFDEQGNMTIRSGGTRAWRCNNPGNLLRSGYSMSKKRRAIGFAKDRADEYAIYPDYETGHEALVLMMRGNIYSPLTLREASIRYVRSDPNHIHNVVKMTGLNPARTIKSLTDLEFEIYWKAIEKIEKWEAGREDFIQKWYVSGVHKKRGVITEYLINISGENIWASKEEALELAHQGRLHTTIVHLKNGKMYLRPEYHGKPFEWVASKQKKSEMILQEVLC